MKYIFKYGKKYIVAIIITIGFLIGQAMLDLTLPEYTSNIVNVGIQQNGISETTPPVVSSDTYNKLLMFDEDINIYYKKINKNDSDYIKKYPILKDEDVYILDTKEEPDLLNTIFLVSFFNEESETVDKLKTELITNYFSNIPGVDENTDIYTLLGYLPEEAINKIKSEFLEYSSNLPNTIMDQAATYFIKTEYERVGMNISGIQTNYLIKTGAIMMLITILSMIATSTVNFFSSRVASGLGRDLRNAVFTKVMSFSNTEFKTFNTSSLITRNTNDITQIQNFIGMFFRVIVYAPIMGVGAVIKVLGTNVSMGWVLILAVGTLTLLLLVMFFVVVPKFKVSQKLLDKLNLVSREFLTGIPVIRAFCTEKHEVGRFEDANTNLTKVNLFINIAGSIMFPLMMFIMNGVTLLILYVGANGINDGVMQVGDMMAFIQYTMHIIMSFLFIAMTTVTVPRAAVSISRIKEVLDKKVAIKDPKTSLEFNKDKIGEVEFKDVSFQYPDADQPVISGINFVAKKGETTAIIGSTGSGKSTAINLIPRFFDVTTGQILVNGVDVRKVNQEDLRKSIGYIPQKGILFSGTIENNVKYGNPKLDKDGVYKALKIAQGYDFVNKMPDKLKTKISQGGTNVSGGQKQRLSIARAIAYNPDIYIFDDSFSALDMKTDQNLRSALNKEIKDSTKIIVAQRVSTILNADQIIVMDEGKIIGKGTHKQLLKNCKVYKEIAESQLSKEEILNA